MFVVATIGKNVLDQTVLFNMQIIHPFCNSAATLLQLDTLARSTAAPNFSFLSSPLQRHCLRGN